MECCVKTNYSVRVRVHGNEWTCHPVHQCGLSMCFWTTVELYGTLLFRIISLTFNLLSNREASPFSLLRQKASDRFGYFHVSSFHFVLGYVTGMEPFSHKLHFPEELGQLYFKWRALHISRRHQCNFPLQYGLISQHFYTLIHNSDIWFSPS